MIARTLFFSLRGHLGVNLSQLVYTPAHETGAEPRTFPIEDLGFIVIETPQMTVTAYALQALAKTTRFQTKHIRLPRSFCRLPGTR